MASKATPNEMANYLTDGFWSDNGLSRRSFDTSGSNTISVKLDGLSYGGKKLARWALESWESVADIEFVETHGAADITFEDPNAGGAWSSSSTIGNTIVSSTVSISDDWLSYYGQSMDSYSFMAYMHEIGHALGLGHQGNYNGSARFGEDNKFTNDSWQMSIMSYFTQTENTNTNASLATTVSPMMVDIIAIQDLYGAPDTDSVSSGNTVYGVGHTGSGYMGKLWDARFETENSSVYEGFPVAMTIYDRDGYDTINFSNDTSKQRIDLRDGAISSAFGLVGNVVVSANTYIEKYIGGSNSDHIVGNSKNNVLSGRDGYDEIFGGLGNDTLYGGNGADKLYGGDGLDHLFGGAGNDAINGGAWNDVVKGQNGNDRLLGSGGNDALLGGAGKDQLFGGTGADILRGGYDNDSVFGGAGNDRVYGGLGNDRVSGGDGKDQVFGYNGSDVLFGANGDDFIFGGNGADYISGGAGNDTIVGESGLDRLHGGSGSDKFLHNGTSADGQDRVFDFNSSEGDQLVFSRSATTSNFSVKYSHVTNSKGERFGDDSVKEAHIVFKPTGKVIWILDDGADLTQIDINLGGSTYDLLA